MLTIVASMEQELAGLRRELRRGFGREDGKSPCPLMGEGWDGGDAPHLSPPPQGGRKVFRGGRKRFPTSLEVLCNKPQLEGKLALPVELHVVGIGGRQAAARLRALLGRRGETSVQSAVQPTGGLLLLGFAGALDHYLSTGDLALSTRYYRAVQGDFQEDFMEADPEMLSAALEAANDAGLRAHQGDSLTVDHLVADPQENQALRYRYPVGTVNMEDYWAAAVAQEMGVPFLAARVVLDLSTQRLPGYLPGISRSPVRAALTTAAMPWRVPTLLGLARQMRVAQQTLTRFALSFISHQQSAAVGRPTADG